MNQQAQAQTNGKTGGAAAEQEVLAAASGGGGGGVIDSILAETAREERAQALLEKQAKIGLNSRLLSSEISDEYKAITIAMIGRELGIQPMTAMRAIALFKSKGMVKPVLSSALKHALATQKVPGFKIVFLQNDARACIVEASKAGTPPQRFEWTVEDSERAGLLRPSQSNEPSNHVKYPKQMFRARCVAMAVDAIAPEATIGMMTVEEAQDEAHLQAVGWSSVVGADGGIDPNKIAPSVTYRTLDQLRAELGECRSPEDFEAFRDARKPDRLQLAEADRKALVTTWTEGYAKAGGKLSRSDTTKAAAKAQATRPANDDAQPHGEPAGAEDAQEPSAEPSQAAKPPRAPRRSPEESRAAAAKVEAELGAEIDACKTLDEILTWDTREEVGARWEKLTPEGKRRLTVRMKARQGELEADAGMPPGDA